MYPQEVYSVEIDNNQIVVRTSNKKYFKKIDLPDVKTVLEKPKLTWTYQNQTLIINVTWMYLVFKAGNCGDP